VRKVLTFNFLNFSARERHSSGGRRSVLSAVSDESERTAQHSSDYIIEKVSNPSVIDKSKPNSNAPNKNSVFFFKGSKVEGFRSDSVV
jgi:hypothetical protein